MKTLATATALAALLAAPAFAQDPTPADNPSATTELPAAKPDTSTAPKDDSRAAAEAGTTAETRQFIDQQTESELLASEVIGAKVYNPVDEELGTVSDIVLADAGGIEGVVLSVGGFLGIGAKSVAVPFASIQQSEDKDGNLKLVLNASVDELTAAPEYTTLAQLKREQEVNDRMSQEPAASDPLAPAPEPPATQ